MKKKIFVINSIFALIMLLTACSSTSPVSTQPVTVTKPATSTNSILESDGSVESVAESIEVTTEINKEETIGTTEESRETETVPMTAEPETTEIKTEAPTKAYTEVPTETIIETTTIPMTTEFENPFIDPGDWTISSYTDYAHDSEIIILGNKEGVELSIEAPKPNLTFDDFAVMYDEELLACEEKTIIDSFKDKTILKYRITHTSPGTSEVFVVSMYEYIELGDECLGYSLTVRGLDQTDGRIVYVTPSGEKYHLSESCAGENAIATTLWDVRQYEYEPCGKCAK